MTRIEVNIIDQDKTTKVVKEIYEPEDAADDVRTDGSGYSRRTAETQRLNHIAREAAAVAVSLHLI